MGVRKVCIPEEVNTIPTVARNTAGVFEVFIPLTEVAYNSLGSAVVCLVMWLFLTSRKVKKEIQAQIHSAKCECAIFHI